MRPGIAGALGLADTARNWPLFLGDAMNRRHFMTTLCIGALTAGIAQAASYEESVVAQLRAQGYGKILVERTLLGRVKISASMNGGHREIILNPRTGEVLRDLWIAAGGAGSIPALIGNNSGASGSSDGSGSDGSGSGADDDGDSGGDSGGGQDDEDEDSSGNSGSGNGGGDDDGGDDDNDD